MADTTLVTLQAELSAGEKALAILQAELTNTQSRIKELTLQVSESIEQADLKVLSTIARRQTEARADLEGVGLAAAELERRIRIQERSIEGTQRKIREFKGRDVQARIDQQGQVIATHLQHAVEAFKVLHNLRGEYERMAIGTPDYPFPSNLQDDLEYRLEYYERDKRQ